jgi:hypothetical protein
VNGDRALRAVEIGTKAGYLILAAIAGWALWSFFRPAKITRDDVEAPTPPIVPNAPGQAPPPPQKAPPTGLEVGGLTAGISAAIIEPVDGGQVARKLFRAVFPATLELVNYTAATANIHVEAVGDFYEWVGGQRLGVRTLLGPFRIHPLQVSRLNVELDSGNVDAALFEFGKASAVYTVFASGRLTQSTTFTVS